MLIADGSVRWRAAERPEARVRAVQRAVRGGRSPCPPWKSLPRGAEEPVKGRCDSLFTARPSGRLAVA